MYDLGSNDSLIWDKAPFVGKIIPVLGDDEDEWLAAPDGDLLVRGRAMMLVKGILYG